MLNTFGHPVEWCWFNWTFSFNTVQQGWIQHVKHVWPPCWMMLIQHFHSTLFNIVEFNMLRLMLITFLNDFGCCWMNFNDVELSLIDIKISIQLHSTLLLSYVEFVWLTRRCNNAEHIHPQETPISCVLKASVGRHVGRHSTDISIGTRPICWPISVASRPACMSADTQSLSHRRLADTLPTRDRYSAESRPILYCHLVAGSQRSFFSTQIAPVCVAHYT